MRTVLWILIVVLGLIIGSIGAVRVWTQSIRVREDPEYVDLLRSDATGKLRAQLFQERKKEREELVGILKTTPYRDPVRSEKVLAAIAKVPRHAFVAVRHRERAYWDRSMPIDYGQTISQPYVVAMMTELLDLQPEDSVLEIGTGSGYQAAVLAEITPHVYTIEILEPLHKKATELLHLLGYKSIATLKADGYYGWKEHAPFKGIIVTAAAGHIPPPLVEQLAPGGRMVIPVGDPYGTQRLILLTKDANGNLRTEDRMPVVFVPMTGAAEATR
ncbi:MAG TPA: protein-L-isoaspartate(D-aspartate) O-methyltransferase [Acidobacteriota bacterium]|nr:protein-L-isoaspartate(D-aspartate) O-methyltransferase [Acidobacteriota bacterium]